MFRYGEVVQWKAMWLGYDGDASPLKEEFYSREKVLIRDSECVVGGLKECVYFKNL